MLLNLKTLDYRRLLLSFAVVALLLWVASRRSFFGDTISSAFLAIALFSVFLILLRTRTSWKELLGVAVVFLLIATVDLRVAGYKASWPVWASFSGIASLGGLSFRVFWREGEERRLAGWTLGPAFLFVGSEWMASYLLDWTEKAHPKVLDLYLYSFDASMHVQFPFVFGRWFAQYPIFGLVSFFIYIGLPIAIGLTYAGCLMRDRRNAPAALISLLIAGPVGILFYNLVPALGPGHIFLRGFPWQPLSYEQASRLFLERVAVAGPRNAFPSLHAAWAFLVFWYARNLSLGERVLAGVFVVFTLCATLGTGEHYFVDLIVAVPFALMIIAIAEAVAKRAWRETTIPLMVGLGLTLAWILALRYSPRIFWASPAVSWGACLLTLFAPYVSSKRLLDPRCSTGNNPHDLESVPAPETKCSVPAAASTE
jgi:hypothetical protein